MSEPASPTAPRKERLSTGQMLHLMRLEVERALRHRYPISCMCIGLDGFVEDAEVAHRKTLMPAVFKELKRVTFQNDVQGLGVWTERFQLAVFPHVEPNKLADLARQLVEGAHTIADPLGRVTVEVEGQDEAATGAADGAAAEGEGDAEVGTVAGGEAREAPHITISIGISHNLHDGEVSFDTLVEDAETGMGLALSAGGDRFLQARDVETEVDRLRAELEHQISEIKQHQASVGQKDTEEEAWARGLVQQVLDSFQAEPDQNESVVRLKKEVISLLTRELRAWRETSTVTQLLASQRQIDQLERRVRKLTDSLGVTEKELKRVMAMKNIDVGVASIYRTVQGLEGDDEGAEQKRDMLKNIFEANLALRSEMRAAKAS